MPPSPFWNGGRGKYKCRSQFQNGWCSLAEVDCDKQLKDMDIFSFQNLLLLCRLLLNRLMFNPCLLCLVISVHNDVTCCFRTAVLDK